MDLIRLVQHKRVTMEIYQEQLDLARAAGDSDRIQKISTLHDHAAKDEQPGSDLKALQEEMAPKIQGRLALAKLRFLDAQLWSRSGHAGLRQPGRAPWP